MQIEILALRHQLAVLERRKKRVRLKAADRVLWVILARFWKQWRSALVIVKPETVIAWHRKGFRLYCNIPMEFIVGAAFTSYLPAFNCSAFRLTL
jgi:hypothetical protein